MRTVNIWVEQQFTMITILDAGEEKRRLCAQKFSGLKS